MIRGGQEEKVVFIRCLVSGTEKICLECEGQRRLLFVCLASGIEPAGVACIPRPALCRRATSHLQCRYSVS